MITDQESCCCPYLGLVIIKDYTSLTLELDFTLNQGKNIGEDELLCICETNEVTEDYFVILTSFCMFILIHK